ncbi:MAG: glycosyltransferase family 2 protein [Chloroflexi bacterium]|nr:glycosyltransferase family 2 protein [Chloroflexota bacterium]MBV9892931.1 glycosyltransferase family 2 protein [Chloroflexota bacterium]
MPTPRVIGLGMVKNEQDIIEPFVRHNLRFLDALVVADNGSVDSTRAILTQLAREFDGLVVGDIPAFGYTQAEYMTRLLHAAQTAFFADYVVLIDADEFIGAADRRQFLMALSAIPPGGLGLAPWRTFVLVADDVSAQSTDPPRTMRNRRTEERPQWRKAILRLDGAPGLDLRISQGNHKVMRTNGDSLPFVLLDTLPLQHFPIRSKDQVIGKGVVGWMAYLAKDAALRTGGGSQKRDIADRVARGERIEPNHLAELSQRYANFDVEQDWKATLVTDTPPTHYIRRYSSGAAAEALPLIVRSWAQALTPVPGALDLTRPGASESAAPLAAGGFDAGWHWDHVRVDVPPFRAIAERYQPASVLDVGCGIGAYLRLLNKLGAEDVFGVDALAPEMTALGPGQYAFHDLTNPLDLGRTFDLVVCTEVAEHLDPASARKLIGTVAKHARELIVFSAAEPGQPGNGHINCQPLPHWLDLWRQHGWRPEAIDSLALRTLASLSWFRRNLMVLRPEGRVHHDGTFVLEKIAERPFTWYGQGPGIRETPFMEVSAEEGGGYV